MHWGPLTSTLRTRRRRELTTRGLHKGQCSLSVRLWMRRMAFIPAQNKKVSKQDTPTLNGFTYQPYSKGTL